MSDTPRTDSEVEIFNDEYTGFKDVGYVSETFASQLERELSAANARIAELEDILRVKDDCLEIRMSMHDKHIMDRIPPSALKYANDLPLIIREHSVNMFYALQKATAPSQPTTLPE